MNDHPTTPHAQPLPSITYAWFSLLRFRSPLLTESHLFSLPVGTEMFHFPTFPPHPLYIHEWVTPHHWCWVSPFGHPRITARLTTPRGLSRPTTSFIGSWYQGIHRTPSNTYNNTHKHTPHTKQCPRRECGQQTKTTITTRDRTNQNRNCRTHKPNNNKCCRARCSHPLCTSQTTHTHHPQHPTLRGGKQ